MTIGIKFVIPLLFENPSFSSSAMKLESGNMKPVKSGVSSSYTHTVEVLTSTLFVRENVICDWVFLHGCSAW